MRVLFDTNILIYREYEKVLPRRMQELMRIFYALDAKILVHPYSLQEISQDKNLRNNELILSKVKSYPVLEPSANPSDDNVFLRTVGEPKDARENVDNHLLYSVYKGEADFLITQDSEILEKSGALNISEKVFDLKDGLAHLGNLLKERQKMPLSPTVERSHAPVICFYRKGDKWIIGEKGKEAIFDDLKGFDYIHYLLTKENKAISAYRLYSHDLPQSDEVKQPRQPEIDQKTRKKVLSEIKKLKEELSSGGIDDRAEYADKEKQVVRLKKYLVPRTRRHRVSGSEEEKARINVGKRIRNAIKKIHHNRATSHLSRYINRATIRTGDDLEYRPNPNDEPKWIFSPVDEVK